MTISPSITSPDRRRLRLVGLLPWLFAGAVVGYAILVGGYAATVVSFALIYAVFVTGLNLFMGFAAQVSFGQNAFAAIGGYVSAVLTASHGWSPLPAMALGMTAAVLAAAIIGFPTLRLKGHYLAMGTLAIGLIAYEITVEWQSVTQGYMGISGIPPLSLAGYEVSSDRGQLVMLALVVAGGAFAAARIRRSRFGRALSAVAGSEEAAQALGIDVARYKLMAFLLSAGFAALAGSLFVHVVGFVSPEVFGLHMVIVTFTMLYVGGIGTVAGPLIGALIVSLLPETFRAFKDYQDLAYGAALILLLIYAPRGLASLFSTRGRS
ncbi:amino acid/amide ABC transporter membrane protein 2, HAAT family (TC 3.A.1.4.-) [Bosea sp. OK403]|uniref:branched-chain amino acid ABC transporter permease n=1 Tax=Bosea sp. OK403 TaxID=1855286 RepID=UPI0008F2CC5D|nr:branched-chain amino acid ABC transporter permease [Bosea sp. OK403]SFI14042.1 amino acid/amide ABC transporter membrane protein 2, HAAT family (TC 3.A.1.4.-) [Bosea sp. OK403]